MVRNGIDTVPRPVGVLGVALGIEHLNGAPVQSGARRGAASSGRNWIPLDESSEFRGGSYGVATTRRY